MSLQSGWAPMVPGRNAWALHGSSMTQAFGPYSSKIFFSAISGSTDNGIDSSNSANWGDRLALGGAGWYVPVEKYLKF